MASSHAPSPHTDAIPHHDSLGSHDYSKGVKYLVDTVPDLQSIPSAYVLPLPICPSAQEASIPVIDLTGLDGPSERRISTIEALSSACAEWGFFRIVNHGIKISLMEEMLRSVEEFFCLSWEEKMKYASDDVMNPVFYGTSLNKSAKQSLDWRDYYRHLGHPIQKSFHLWPDNPPNYREVTKEYLEEVWWLALKITGAISEGLGLDSNYIEEALGEGCQILAPNYHPPCPEPCRTLGLAAHSNHVGLTILMQNDVDGLQVKYNDKWIQVGHVPETFVVNLGDFLEILSNGRYKSVEHRTTVHRQRTRISVAVGHGPELTTIVAPASPLVDEKSKPKYRPIMYKDYVRCHRSTGLLCTYNKCHICSLRYHLTP